jgi:hypothetical protein
LSCASRELHTRQWHPGEGTPMEVPEPSTVSLIGSLLDSRDMEENGAASGPHRWELPLAKYDKVLCAAKACHQ